MTDNISYHNISYKNAWYSVIKSYIDENEDINKLSTTKNLILTKILSLHLLTANPSIDDKSTQKNFDKLYKKAKNTPANENIKNLTTLKSLYQTFVQNNWLTPIDETLHLFEQESCFYKLWFWSVALQLDYVTPATHIAKLTHSSSSCSAIIDSIQDNKIGFLTSTSLKNQKYDGAYPSATLSKIAKFLLLTSENSKPIGLLLKQKDNSPLQSFFKGDELDNITQLFFDKLNLVPKADALIKQVYFPIDDKNYHLLVVLKSSVLIQAIFDNYYSKQVRKDNETTKKQYINKKYTDNTYKSIPNTLLLATVRSQLQNVSVNNGSRGGDIRLFCSKPPTWQSQIKPPIYQKNLFNHRKLNYLSQENILGFRQFLMQFDKAGLSIKDPVRLKGAVNWLNAIIDDFFTYHYSLLLLPKGWTKDIHTQLKLSHQFFADPYRDDNEFLIAKKHNDWQSELIADFVNWLTHKLAGQDKQLLILPEQMRVCRDVFKNALYPYLDTLQRPSNQ